LRLFSRVDKLEKLIFSFNQKIKLKSGDLMNKKTMYILVAVLVAVIVVGGVAAYALMNTGGNNGEEEKAKVADATSLQFTIEDETGTYKYSAKNMDTDTLLRMEYLDEEYGFIIILDNGEEKAWSTMSGEWAEENYETTYNDWNPVWEDYLECLADWTEGDGEWTSEDETVKISDITVNPELDDSLFQHS
jgi:hypothetical protein